MEKGFIKVRYAKFGPAGNSQAFYDEGMKHTSQAPEWLERIGLDAYEYQCGNGITAKEPSLREVGEKAKEHGISLSLHAPYYISLSGIDIEKRLKSIDYIKQSVAAAEYLGADIIVVHTGSAAKISREEAVSLAKDTVYKALEATADSAVHIGLETMGKQNQLGTLDEVLDICSLDSTLRPVVDFGHLNARAGGLFSTEDDYLEIFDRISSSLGAEYAERLHCHFSKIEYTAAGEKRHLTFEDKTFGPDFEPLMRVISEQRLCPTIICESAGTMAKDALAMKEYYRERAGR